MTRLHFICTFKSDIVLHSSSNSEGKIDRFDYIAGSNFLGMVAREYSSFGSDAFDVFHSGKVRFLDAHILVDNKNSFQVPFAWFAPKGMSLKEAINEKELYNDHFIKDEYKQLVEQGVQLKQQRVGFITSNGQIADIEHIYRQKSAYDRKNRRSKKSAMFGYYALKKGTKWSFCVELDDDKHKEKIKKILEKSTRLGKSKSSEYGRVKIKHIDKPIEETISQIDKPIEIDNKNYILLYAYSRLALTDVYGNNSYKFDLRSLMIDSKAKIDWEKSQIRTRRYAPYNTKRENRDFERLIIDKGSVIAVEVDSEFDVKGYQQKISKGIGLYLSEGHGKVIVNPQFLAQKKLTFAKQSKTKEDKKQDKKYGAVNSWLREQDKKREKEFELLKSVKAFIKEHNVKNKKSQWGQIRSLCSAYSSSDKLYKALFSEEIVNNHPKGFLLHGIAKDKWSKNLIGALKEQKEEQKDDYINFIKLLSIYAPKEDDKKGANDE